MKKITLALLLIAAFCLFAVSPVAAAVDPYKPYAGNTTALFAFSKNAVSFPTATYVPSSVRPSALVPVNTVNTKTGLDVIFKVPMMSDSTFKTSIGGNYFVVTKFPWEL